jgi:cell division protein FtsQ
VSSDRPLNRAHEVRKRRASEEAKRQQQATQRAYRPLPPVTVRGSAYVPTRPHARDNTRRFQTAIGLPQPRTHISILPGEWTGKQLIAVIVTVLFAAALYFMWSSPTFHVTEPQVIGAARIAPAEITSALGINGESIFLIRTEELATRLRLNFPELASAEVTIGLPNQVSVHVTERQPIIFWQQGEGYTWVDASGVAFHPHGQADGLILVSALAAPPSGPAVSDDPLSPPPYVSPDLVKAIQTLAPSAPPGSPLIYHPQHGLGWNDAQGWQVFFGTESQDMTLKLQVYQSLVISLTERNIYPAFISIEHTDAPYYRMAE